MEDDEIKVSPRAVSRKRLYDRMGERDKLFHTRKSVFMYFTIDGREINENVDKDVRLPRENKILRRLIGDILRETREKVFIIIGAEHRNKYDMFGSRPFANWSRSIKGVTAVADICQKEELGGHEDVERNVVKEGVLEREYIEERHWISDENIEVRNDAAERRKDEDGADEDIALGNSRWRRGSPPGSLKNNEAATQIVVNNRGTHYSAEEALCLSKGWISVYNPKKVCWSKPRSIVKHDPA